MLSRVTHCGDQQLLAAANSRDYPAKATERDGLNVDLIKVRMKMASQAQKHSAKMVAEELYLNIP